MSDSDRLFERALRIGLILLLLVAVTLLAIILLSPERRDDIEQYARAQAAGAERFDVLSTTNEQRACAEAAEGGASESDQREKDDLCAQFRSAAAAERMVRLSDRQITLTTLELGAIALSLIFTGVAAFAASRAADIAEKAVRTADRPHLVVQRIELEGMDERAEVQGAMTVEKPVRYEYAFRNHGKGIGWIKEHAVSFEETAKDTPPPVHPNFQLPFKTNWPLPPTHAFLLNKNPDLGLGMSDKLKEQIAQGEMILYAVGRLIYTDVDGNEHRHRFAYVWSPKFKKFSPYREEAYWEYT